MWVVRVGLQRPYSFVVVALLIAIFGVLAALNTPTDIFPSLNIPVVRVVWNDNGLLPNDRSGRRPVSLVARARSGCGSSS
jgi:multidrug efflux pump subunit AcrB